ncbi:hypothetical protein FVE85_2210 [Porphyridium purpureum]|uniref:Uncharacterized protein n=1 Tax=Porphyridium purpureum TaxID=35688 RepID=A0A5J4YY55_PORPP|nr:hypothetical protein FVE85_2210 [Porphyridium purpureum]|eukprot:POR7871..scf209_3
MQVICFRKPLRLPQKCLPWSGWRVVICGFCKFERLHDETTERFSAVRLHRYILPSPLSFILMNTFGAPSREIFAPPSEEDCRFILIETLTAGKGSKRAKGELAVFLRRAVYHRRLPYARHEPHSPTQSSDITHHLALSQMRACERRGRPGTLTIVKMGILDMQRRLQSDEVLFHLSNMVLVTIFAVSQRQACLPIARCNAP